MRCALVRASECIALRGEALHACAVQLISAMAALAEFDAEVEKLFVYANRAQLQRCYNAQPYAVTTRSSVGQQTQPQQSYKHGNHSESVAT